MATMAQSAANWRESHAFTHTLTLTQLQPRGAKRQLSYYIIWISIFFTLNVPYIREARQRLKVVVVLRWFLVSLFCFVEGFLLLLLVALLLFLLLFVLLLLSLLFWG